jgi:ABC-type antimicrobial peptide transport system, permease component
MDFKNLIKIAIKALLNNKTRGFLTMLGIIIGVASVIAMLAIGSGSKLSIREEIGSMGSNMIMVSPGNGRFGGVRQSGSSMQTLKLSDYETIVREASYIDKITPTVNSSGQAIKGSNNTPTTIYGVNEQYLDIRGYVVESGSVFTDSDIVHAAKVCIVGKTVVNELFGEGRNPWARSSVSTRFL